MRAMTYKSARRAQRALLAIGAGLTLTVAAAPVAQATPAGATSAGTCTANANGIINSDGASAGANSTCPGGNDAASDTAGQGKGKGKGDGGSGGTGHKVG